MLRVGYRGVRCCVTPEPTVDRNGGEKKIGQAFDYASLIEDPSKTLLLFTFHVDRRKTKPGNPRISQEAFIYICIAKERKERKMGILVERNIRTKRVQRRS